MDESVQEKLKHLEQPSVGTLKLSEAIRIGARLRPQCDGEFFRDGGSCALGAAFEARFGYPKFKGGRATFDTPDMRTGRSLSDGLREAFPFLYRDEFCLNRLGESVYLMNDSGVSRELIADWLASQGY